MQDFPQGLTAANSITLTSGSINAPPGTTTTPPLVVPSGTLVTTPSAGIIENNGTYLYFTPSAVRQTIHTNATNVSSPIVTKTSAYTLTANDHTILADATTAAFSITLPTAASAYNAATLSGAVYTIKRINTGANNVTIQASGAELIDGANTQILNTQWTLLEVKSNGTSWFII